MEHSYLARWFPPPSHRYEFASASSESDRLADFERTLRICAERGVRLMILCPPIHARFQEAVATAGAWSHYEQWKRELANRVRAQQARPAGLGSVEFWDFSVFNELTCESLPTDGAGPMRYWIDSAHFTPEFGSLLLDEMLGIQPPSASRLGMRLDRVEIEDHLASIRAGLEVFRVAQPAVVADVRAAMGGNLAVPSIAGRP